MKTEKRKFSKLMGKKAEYTGVKTKPKEEHDGGRVLFLDVRHKGKIYSDHVWIKGTDALDHFEFGSKIGFTGVGYMYSDKNGVRKQGVTRCHGFHALYDTYDKGASRKNYNQMFRRKDKGRKR